MTEQMQDHFEKLDEVAGMLTITDFDNTLTHAQLRDARHLLTSTTNLLRQDYDQMARARDAAIELLTKVRNDDDYAPWLHREYFAKVIALLDGSAKEEGEQEYDRTAPPVEDVLAALAAEVPAEEWKKVPPSDDLDGRKRAAELEKELALRDGALRLACEDVKKNNALLQTSVEDLCVAYKGVAAGRVYRQQAREEADRETGADVS